MMQLAKTLSVGDNDTERKPMTRMSDASRHETLKDFLSLSHSPLHIDQERERRAAAWVNGNCPFHDGTEEKL